MTRAAVPSLLISLLLVGCGSICDRAEATATSFTEKALPCGSTAKRPTFDRARCEESLASCTAADTQTVHTYLDCLERLPTCEPAHAADFTAAVLACANPMQGKSPACFVQ